MNYHACTFGTRPDSRSPLARKIEAFAADREALLEDMKNADKLAARPRLSRQQRALEAKRALRKFRTVPSHRRIAEEVATERGIPLAAMLSSSRQRDLVLARQHYAWRLFSETDASYPRMGKYMGGKDHTSAIHAVEKYMQRHRIAERPAHRRSVAK